MKFPAPSVRSFGNATLNFEAISKIFPLAAAYIADGAITLAKLASNSVDASKIVDGSVGTAEIADNAVTNAKMADNACGAAEITDGSVGTNELADNAVTSAKILNGTIATADIADAQITVAKLAGVPCARVYRSSDQSISNSSNTVITFNSERYDTESIHSTSSNTGRLTAQTAGVYCISVTVSWEGALNGYRSLSIRINGSTTVAATLRNTTSGGIVEGADQTVTTDYYLGVGDYAEAVVFQNSGGSLKVWSSDAYSPEFMMHWVSP